MILTSMRVCRLSRGEVRLHGRKGIVAVDADSGKIGDLSLSLQRVAQVCRRSLESRDAGSRERGDKRRKEAEAVGRLFPGESR